MWPTFQSRPMTALARLLFVVSGTFKVRDVMCVEPLVPFALLEREQLKKGDKLELRKPDGSVTQTTVYGLEWMVPSKGALCMTLPPLLREDDIPPGTENLEGAV
jgi:hypothetical protein